MAGDFGAIRKLNVPVGTVYPETLRFLWRKDFNLEAPRLCHRPARQIQAA